MSFTPAGRTRPDTTARAAQRRQRLHPGQLADRLPVGTTCRSSNNCLTSVALFSSGTLRRSHGRDNVMAIAGTLSRPWNRGGGLGGGFAAGAEEGVGYGFF